MSLTKRFMEENGYLERQQEEDYAVAMFAALRAWQQYEEEKKAEMVTDCCGVPDRYYYDMDEFVCSRCDAEKPRRITREQYQQEQENQQ